MLRQIRCTERRPKADAHTMHQSGMLHAAARGNAAVECADSLRDAAAFSGHFLLLLMAPYARSLRQASHRFVLLFARRPPTDYVCHACSTPQTVYSSPLMPATRRRQRYRYRRLPMPRHATARVAQQRSR